MEKITINNNIPKKENRNSFLTLENRQQLKLTGVTEAISTNTNIIQLKINGEIVTINGNNLQVSKLDIDEGIVEANGLIDCVNYNKSSKGFFKKLFK